MEKNLGGKPPFYATPEELELSIETYFATLKKGQPATITGLALYLGFESRQSFYDYEKREPYTYTIRRARLAIESLYEAALTTAKSAQGAIFALKNFGWRDELSYNLIDMRAATAALFPDELLTPEQIEQKNGPDKPKLTPPD